MTWSNHFTVQRDIYLRRFEEDKQFFKWFIIEYFGESTFFQLEEFAKKKELGEFENLLSIIWSGLPDNEFNIMKMPEGWGEFLWLMENVPQQDN